MMIEGDTENWALFDADMDDYQRDLEERRVHFRSLVTTVDYLDECTEVRDVFLGVLSAVHSGYPELTDNEMRVVFLWLARNHRRNMARVMISENSESYTEGVSQERSYQVYNNAWKKISAKIGKRLRPSLEKDHTVIRTRIVPIEKQCKACGQVFPISEFFKDNRATDEHTARCKPCYYAQQRELVARRNGRALQAAGD